jgi:hypothetical protein
MMKLTKVYCCLLATAALAAASVARAQDEPRPTQPQPPKPTPGGISLPRPQESGDSAADGGTLKLSMEFWDFGTKWYGEPASEDLTLTNVGDQALKISNVKSSCGCTVAKPKSGGVWNNRVLAPGEAETMTLTYNTRKGARKVSQKVTILSSDKDNPSIEFVVRGEVKNVFEAKPYERVTFGRLERDSVQEQKIELVNNMDEDVFPKIKEAPDTGPFDIQLKEIEKGRKYELVVTTKPPLNVGGNTTKVEIETGLEQIPSMTIPVSAFVTPAVSVAPPRLYMSPRLTKPFEKTIRVNYRSDKPIEVKEVISSHPDLIKAEVVPMTNPESQAQRPTMYHTVRVSLPAAENFPAEGAKLTIVTNADSAEYQRLEVPIVTQAAFERVARDRAGRPVGKKAKPGQNLSEGDEDAQPKPDPHEGHDHP